MSEVSITRWAREERRLTSAEVDGCFERERTRLQVFAFQTRRLRVEPHEGRFSIKAVISGREHYQIDGHAVALDPGALLLVNSGEQYSSCIENVQTSAVSCFLSEHVARQLPEVVPLPFMPTPFLAHLRQRLIDTLVLGEGADAVSVAGVVHELTIAVVHESLQRFRPNVLPAVVRRATRRDLIARVSRARDYIDDHHGLGVTLDQLAEIACLSKYHLLRVFAEVFGRTPFVYAQDRRLRYARLLQARGASDGEAARMTGYASASTLGRALRKHNALRSQV